MFSIKRILMGLIALFAVIQLIPVHRTNPPEPDPIRFTNAQAEALAKRATPIQTNGTGTRTLHRCRGFMSIM